MDEKMAQRREHLERYLRENVDWGVIAFLMMLFMIAGALERTGAARDGKVKRPLRRIAPGASALFCRRRNGMRPASP